MTASHLAVGWTSVFLLTEGIPETNDAYPVYTVISSCLCCKCMYYHNNDNNNKSNFAQCRGNLKSNQLDVFKLKLIDCYSICVFVSGSDINGLFLNGKTDNDFSCSS